MKRSDGLEGFPWQTDVVCWACVAVLAGLLAWLVLGVR
jgi:membrane-associated phospholipid phosphatase